MKRVRPASLTTRSTRGPADRLPARPASVSRRKWRRRLELGVAMLGLLGIGEGLIAAGPATGIPVPSDHTPRIFPEPQEVKETSARFFLDQQAVIAVPAIPDPADLRIARLLMGDLSDRHGIAVPIVRVSELPRGRRAIVIGNLKNPLVKAAAERLGLSITPSSPRSRGLCTACDRPRDYRGRQR